jgi:hypothetical protein
MWSNTAVANDTGKFTFLGLNQCAPFEGVLFDPTATASILSQIQTAEQQCQIKLEYDMRVQSLEREADALAHALKKQSKKNPVLWVAVGIVGGVAISYGTYRAFN